MQKQVLTRSVALDSPKWKKEQSIIEQEKLRLQEEMCEWSMSTGCTYRERVLGLPQQGYRFGGLLCGSSGLIHPNSSQLEKVERNDRVLSYEEAFYGVRWGGLLKGGSKIK